MDVRIATLEAQAEKRRKKTKTPSARTQINRIIASSRKSGWCCSLCGQPFTEITHISIDHIKPICEGGTDAHVNLQAAHSKRNYERGNMPVLFYRMFSVLTRKYPEITIDVFAVKRCDRERKQLRRMAKKSRKTTTGVDIVQAAE